MTAVMAAPSTFAEKLKAALAAGGITQSELADRIGVRRATVSAWVADDGSLPKFDLACKLAQALGISMEALCSNEWHLKAEEDGAEDEE